MIRRIPLQPQDTMTKAEPTGLSTWPVDQCASRAYKKGPMIQFDETGRRKRHDPLIHCLLHLRADHGHYVWGKIRMGLTAPFSAWRRSSSPVVLDP